MLLTVFAETLVAVMVDFQSRFRLYGHGYTAPAVKYPVATFRELYHEQAPLLFKRRPKGKKKKKKKKKNASVVETQSSQIRFKLLFVLNKPELL